MPLLSIHINKLVYCSIFLPILVFYGKMMKACVVYEGLSFSSIFLLSMHLIEL
ncbi:hypothetical protein JHK84_043260 [Glycine max]|nr:hypothetical protein JHK87_042985 [Glycine soja]KAG5117147.1 hypothetical protein JHK84_043260 [Glycine max]